MFKKKRRKEQLREDVCSHVGGGYPVGLKRAFRNMLGYEMVVNVDMFGSGRYGFRVGEGESALVVT